MVPEDFRGQPRGKWAFDMLIPGADPVAVQFFVSRQDTDRFSEAETRGQRTVRVIEYLRGECDRRGVWFIPIPRDQALNAEYIRSERARFLAAKPATIVEPEKPAAEIGIRSADTIKPDDATGLAVFGGL